ncbi:MAG: hypothetical protein WCS89_04230 [Candidatus Paceibacterota bacterium]
MKRKQVVISESALLAIDVCKQMVRMSLETHLKVRDISISFLGECKQTENSIVSGVVASFHLCDSSHTSPNCYRSQSKFTAHFDLCKYKDIGWCISSEKEMTLSKSDGSVAVFMSVPFLRDLHLKKGFDDDK